MEGWGRGRGVRWTPTKLPGVLAQGRFPGSREFCAVVRRLGSVPYPKSRNRLDQLLWSSEKLQILPTTPRCTFTSGVFSCPCPQIQDKLRTPLMLELLFPRAVASQCPVKPTLNPSLALVIARTCHSPEIIDISHPRARSHSRTMSHSRALSYPRYSHTAGLCHPSAKGTSQDPVTLHTQNHPGPDMPVCIYWHFPGSCHRPYLALSGNGIWNVNSWAVTVLGTRLSPEMCPDLGLWGVTLSMV